MATTPAGVADAVAAVRARIAAAAERAGRDPAGVLLVAVTKTVAADRIRELVACGVRDVGENRVQEAAVKYDEFGGAFRWHLVGHLQTNKAGRAASVFDTVHSVDSERVAAALAERRPPGRGDLDVLLEVELTGIAGHTGFRPEELETAVTAVAAVAGLHLRGLMAMAPYADDPEAARPTFSRLRALRDDLEQRTGVALPELSMGMSADFEVAVEEGATMLRLGRVIFGERPQRG